MDTPKLKSLRELGDTQAWLRIWFFGSALAVGVYAGTLDFRGFHPGYFLLGFFGVLIANIPVWVIFDMLRRLLLTKHEIHLVNTTPQDTPET